MDNRKEKQESTSLQLAKPKWMSVSRFNPDTDGQHHPILTKENYSRDVEASQRSPYYQDLGSILHLAQFRRLGRKTQVYTMPADGVRTRLIHSLEVSHIAKQLWRMFIFQVNKKSPAGSINIHQDDCDYLDVLESICLAHDIGHPPFAHSGETTLRSIYTGMNGGFDSNIQNLRILTNLNPIGSNYRLNLTAAVLDAILKEKPEGSFQAKDEHGNSLFSEIEKIYVNAISEETGTNNLRHPLTYFMVCADDISYISSDIEDALKLGDLSWQDLKRIFLESNFVGFADGSPKKSSSDWEDLYTTRCRSNQNFGPIKSAIIKGLIRKVELNFSDFVSWSRFPNANDLLNRLPDLLNRYSVATRLTHPTSGKKLEFGNFLYMSASAELREMAQGFESTTYWSTVQSKQDTDVTKTLKDLGDVPSAQSIADLKSESLKKIIHISERIQNDNALGKTVVKDLYSILVPPDGLLRSQLLLECNKRLAFIKSREFSLEIERLMKNETTEAYKIQRVFVDYISGMTDDFAIKELARLQKSPAVKLWNKRS